MPAHGTGVAGGVVHVCVGRCVGWMPGLCGRACVWCGGDGGGGRGPRLHGASRGPHTHTHTHTPPPPPPGVPNVHTHHTRTHAPTHQCWSWHCPPHTHHHTHHHISTTQPPHHPPPTDVGHGGLGQHRRHVAGGQRRLQGRQVVELDDLVGMRTAIGSRWLKRHPLGKYLYFEILPGRGRR